MQRFKGFTLVEVLVVITLLAIMSVLVIVILNPNQRIWRTQATEALAELKEMAKAVELYVVDYGSFPPDENEDIPAVISEYISFKSSWPEGPFPGSVYDYDNWADGRSCIDNSVEGTIQMTIRNVTRRNPDNSDTWAWYVPIQGNGGPHCENINEYDKGECITCTGFQL